MIKLTQDQKRCVTALAFIFDDYIDNEAINDFNIQMLTASDQHSVKYLLAPYDNEVRNNLVNRAMKRSYKRCK